MSVCRTCLVGVVGWLALGCGEDVIQHGIGQGTNFDEAGGSFTAGGVTGFATVGDGGGSNGNFPEPAQARCGLLPGEVAPLSGLISAWGVRALPGARDPDGEDVAVETVRLRFSDQALEHCAETFAPDQDWCIGPAEAETCGWGLGLTLDPSELVPGSYPIEDLIDPNYAVSIAGQDDSMQPIREGTLVLYTVTPDCIVGEINGTNPEDGEPDQNGGFVAELCQQQCVPNATRGCS